MKTWFAELLDARPWGLATLVVVALCSVSFYPTPAVDLLTLASLPLLIFYLKKWKLLHCRWLYVHAVIVWWAAYAFDDISQRLWPFLHAFPDSTNTFYSLLVLILHSSVLALVLSCITLPLLRRFMRATTSLTCLWGASVLLWLSLQKTLFFLTAIVYLLSGRH